jgi:hypothetical protein
MVIGGYCQRLALSSDVLSHPLLAVDASALAKGALLRGPLALTPSGTLGGSGFGRIFGVDVV